jgi:hypothetical protein
MLNALLAANSDATFWLWLQLIDLLLLLFIELNRQSM